MHKNTFTTILNATVGMFSFGLVPHVALLLMNKDTQLKHKLTTSALYGSRAALFIATAGLIVNAIAAAIVTGLFFLLPAMGVTSFSLIYFIITVSTIIGLGIITTVLIATPLGIKYSVNKYKALNKNEKENLLTTLSHNIHHSSDTRRKQHPPTEKKENGKLINGLPDEDAHISRDNNSDNKPVDLALRTSDVTISGRIHDNVFHAKICIQDGTENDLAVVNLAPIGKSVAESKEFYEEFYKSIKAVDSSQAGGEKFFKSFCLQVNIDKDTATFLKAAGNDSADLVSENTSESGTTYTLSLPIASAISESGGLIVNKFGRIFLYTNTEREEHMIGLVTKESAILYANILDHNFTENELKQILIRGLNSLPLSTSLVVECESNLHNLRVVEREELEKFAEVMEEKGKSTNLMSTSSVASKASLPISTEYPRLLSPSLTPEASAPYAASHSASTTTPPDTLPLQHGASHNHPLPANSSSHEMPTNTFSKRKKKTSYKDATTTNHGGDSYAGADAVAASANKTHDGSDANVLGTPATSPLTHSSTPIILENYNTVTLQYRRQPSDTQPTEEENVEDSIVIWNPAFTFYNYVPRTVNTSALPHKKDLHFYLQLCALNTSKTFAVFKEKTQQAYRTGKSVQLDRETLQLLYISVELPTEFRDAFPNCNRHIPLLDIINDSHDLSFFICDDGCIECHSDIKTPFTIGKLEIRDPARSYLSSSFLTQFHLLLQDLLTSYFVSCGYGDVLHATLDENDQLVIHQSRKLKITNPTHTAYLDKDITKKPKSTDTDTIPGNTQALAMPAALPAAVAVAADTLTATPPKSVGVTPQEQREGILSDTAPHPDSNNTIDEVQINQHSPVTHGNTSTAVVGNPTSDITSNKVSPPASKEQQRTIAQVTQPYISNNTPLCIIGDANYTRTGDKSSTICYRINDKHIDLLTDLTSSNIARSSSERTLMSYVTLDILRESTVQLCFPLPCDGNQSRKLLFDVKLFKGVFPNSPICGFRRSTNCFYSTQMTENRTIEEHILSTVAILYDKFHLNFCPENVMGVYNQRKDWTGDKLHAEMGHHVTDLFHGKLIANIKEALKDYFCNAEVLEHIDVILGKDGNISVEYDEEFKEFSPPSYKKKKLTSLSEEEEQATLRVPRNDEYTVVDFSRKAISSTHRDPKNLTNTTNADIQGRGPSSDSRASGENIAGAVIVKRNIVPLSTNVAGTLTTDQRDREQAVTRHPKERECYAEGKPDLPTIMVLGVTDEKDRYNANVMSLQPLDISPESKCCITLTVKQSSSMPILFALRKAAKEHKKVLLDHNIFRSATTFNVTLFAENNTKKEYQWTDTHLSALFQDSEMIYIDEDGDIYIEEQNEKHEHVRVGSISKNRGPNLVIDINIASIYALRSKQNGEQDTKAFFYSLQYNILQAGIVPCNVVEQNSAAADAALATDDPYPTHTEGQSLEDDGSANGQNQDYLPASHTEQKEDNQVPAVEPEENEPEVKSKPARPELEPEDDQGQEEEEEEEEAPNLTPFAGYKLHRIHTDGLSNYKTDQEKVPEKIELQFSLESDIGVVAFLDDDGTDDIRKAFVEAKAAVDPKAEADPEAKADQVTKVKTVPFGKNILLSAETACHLDTFSDTGEKQDVKFPIRVFNFLLDSLKDACEIAINSNAEISITSPLPDSRTIVIGKLIGDKDDNEWAQAIALSPAKLCEIFFLKGNKKHLMKDFISDKALGDLSDNELQNPSDVVQFMLLFSIVLDLAASIKGANCDCLNAIAALYDITVEKKSEDDVLYSLMKKVWDRLNIIRGDAICEEMFHDGYFTLPCGIPKKQVDDGMDIAKEEPNPDPTIEMHQLTVTGFKDNTKRKKTEQIPLQVSLDTKSSIAAVIKDKKAVTDIRTSLAQAKKAKKASKKSTKGEVTMAPLSTSTLMTAVTDCSLKTLSSTGQRQNVLFGARLLYILLSKIEDDAFKVLIDSDSCIHISLLNPPRDIVIGKLGKAKGRNEEGIIIYPAELCKIFFEEVNGQCIANDLVPDIQEDMLYNEMKQQPGFSDTIQVSMFVDILIGLACHATKTPLPDFNTLDGDDDDILDRSATIVDQHYNMCTSKDDRDSFINMVSNGYFSFPFLKPKKQEVDNEQGQRDLAGPDAQYNDGEEHGDDIDMPDYAKPLEGAASSAGERRTTTEKTPTLISDKKNSTHTDTTPATATETAVGNQNTGSTHSLPATRNAHSLEQEDGPDVSNEMRSVKSVTDICAKGANNL